MVLRRSGTRSALPRVGCVGSRCQGEDVPASGARRRRRDVLRHNPTMKTQANNASPRRRGRRPNPPTTKEPQ
ncbi:hypothetical protein FM112_15965 [Gulosibacter sp. 10]|nr:hypothetical protein FM112_15965 [Gulosibacter sp. 10]